MAAEAEIDLYDTIEDDYTQVCAIRCITIPMTICKMGVSMEGSVVAILPSGSLSVVTVCDHTGPGRLSTTCCQILVNCRNIEWKQFNNDIVCHLLSESI